METVETYLQLLSRRRMKRKISEKKYVKMINQLMLWSVSVAYFEEEEDYWLDDDEQEFDDE